MEFGLQGGLGCQGLLHRELRINDFGLECFGLQGLESI